MSTPLDKGSLRNGGFPRWPRLIVAGVFVLELAVYLVRRGMYLQDASANILAQLTIGGVVILAMLGFSLLTTHGDRLRHPSTRLLLFLLVVPMILLCAMHIKRILPVLTMPYDMASWSEPYFLLDIVKFRTGATLYLPPDDSNSNAYSPAAPALTYLLAWMAGKSTSIVAFRWIQQLYLALAAMFAGLAAWDLVHLSSGGSREHPPRGWLLFFFPASFLVASNPLTNAFTVYLNTDPLALLLTAIAFWILTRYAVTGSVWWLFGLAVAPSAAFLGKQYLALFAAAYVIFLLLEQRQPLRRTVLFAVVCFGCLVLTVAICYAVWGDPFRYWVFEVLSTHVVSFHRIYERFSEAVPSILPTILGGWVLLQVCASRVVVGLFAVWTVLTLGATYTSGVTYNPTHFGPSALVGACFALAAVTHLWHKEDRAGGTPRMAWIRLAFLVAVVVMSLAGMQVVFSTGWRPLPDFHRYAQEIEKEFQDLPADQVLLDSGEWVYLERNILMKDRVHCLHLHRVPHFGIIDRLQKQQYKRLLVRKAPTGEFFYDFAGPRGIGPAIEASYREVRRIPGVNGYRDWRFAWMTMSDIFVMEPIPRPTESEETTSEKH